MKKIKSFLSGLKDYVGKEYMHSLYYGRWDQLVWLTGLLAAILVFINSNANLLLTITTPFVWLLAFQIIKVLLYVARFFYNVIEDLRREEITFLYFYKD